MKEVTSDRAEGSLRAAVTRMGLRLSRGKKRAKQGGQARQASKQASKQEKEQ